MTANSLEKLTDEQLVALAKKEKRGIESEAAATLLVTKYTHFVQSIAQKYFLQSGGRDDVCSTGFIGLTEAINTFDPNKGVPFKNYARICITGEIQSAVTGAARKKHIPLNTALSLEKVVDYRSGDERQLIGMIPDLKALNPENKVIASEEYLHTLGRITLNMTCLQKQAFLAHLRKEPYKVTAERLGKNVKSIDNALQLARKKAQKELKYLKLEREQLYLEERMSQSPIQVHRRPEPRFSGAGEDDKNLDYWRNQVITAYKNLAQYLPESAIRLNKFFDAMYSIVLRNTLEGRIKFCEDVVALFESTAQELLSVPVSLQRRALLIQKLIDAMCESAYKYY